MRRRGGRRRRGARDELPLRHRAVVQLDQPRVPARRHLRQGAAGDRQASVSQIKVGLPTERDTEMSCLTSQAQYDKTMSYIKLGIEGGARLAYGGKRPADPALAQGLLRRADGIRRRHRRHAHRARGDLRAGGEHPALVGRGRHAGARERARRRAHLLDLDARPRPRASPRVASGGGLRVDQRRVARITSACRSAATSSRASGARNRSRSSCACTQIKNVNVTLATQLTEEDDHDNGSSRFT